MVQDPLSVTRKSILYMGTEQFFKNIINSAKTLHLEKEEKDALRFSLAGYMKKNPATANPMPRKNFAYFVSLGSISLMLKKPVLRYASLAAVMILFLGGGISYAAGKSLPGDLLYTVKVNVNEKLYALALVSGEAKAEYDVSLAQKRLEETEKIISENKLDPETSAKMQGLINGHVKSAKKRISSLAAKNDGNAAIKVSSELEASFIAHAKILTNLSAGKSQEAAAPSDTILFGIIRDASDVKKERESTEAKFSAGSVNFEKSKAEKLLSQINAEFIQIEKAVSEKRGEMDAISRANIEANLTLANENIIEGKEKLSAGDNKKAFIFFQNALRVMQEINIYLSNEGKLNIGGKEKAQIKADIKGDKKENKKDDGGIEIKNIDDQLKIGI